MNIFKIIGGVLRTLRILEENRPEILNARAQSLRNRAARKRAKAKDAYWSEDFFRATQLGSKADELSARALKLEKRAQRLRGNPERKRK
jgi:hypothetical protein